MKYLNAFKKQYFITLLYYSITTLKIQNFFKLFLLLGTKDHLKYQKP